jgi:hypothetical protein
MTFRHALFDPLEPLILFSSHRRANAVAIKTFQAPDTDGPGFMEAAVFVGLTNPASPVVLGEMTRTEGSPSSTHRDMKV